MRQDTLGKWAGFTREHVNRFLAQLKEWGIISWMGRHYQSNIYYVNQAFRDHFLRAKLKHIFSALAYFHIGLLEPNVTLINRYIYKYVRNTYYVTVDMDSINNVRACAREASTIQQKDKAVITEFVSGISTPALTTHDKIILSRYDEDVVREALQALAYKQKQSKLDTPVAYLVGACKRIAEKKKNAPIASPSKIVSSIPEKKEVRDASFMKREDEKLAHWDVVQLGDQLDRFSKLPGCKSMADSFITQYKISLTNHDEAICHICLEHGKEYKTPAKFYNPSANSQRIQEQNQEWEKNKFEANDKYKGQRGFTPFLLGTVAPAYHIKEAESSSSTSMSAQSVPPPAPSPFSPKGYAEAGPRLEVPRPESPLPPDQDKVPASTTINYDEFVECDEYGNAIETEIVY